jgi:uncharacterized repeat protein (TIGR03803 family)
MQRTLSSLAVVGASLVWLCLALAASAPAGSKEQVLYSFDEGNNGAYPLAGLASDSNGNLYGTTELAGAGGGGIVFELTPEFDGTWTFTLLHSFGVIGDDGGDPLGGLTFDNAGNLYGTASIGGDPFDAGTAYQLSPGENGWNFSVIYAFPGGKEAGYPSGPLLFDGRDTFYGTAGGGITNCRSQCGTVFQLKRNRQGQWVEKVLHRFDGGRGGGGPVGGVISDSSGNLYGTTIIGGDSHCDGGCGTIFKLSRQANGWKRTTLYRFTGKADGYFSYGGLVLKAGNLYGVTSVGGDLSCNPPNGCGTVFRLTKDGMHTVLHRFTQTGGDGAFPAAGMTLAPSGVIFGTTSQGGDPVCGGCGLVFKLKGDRLRIVYKFDGTHGAEPEAPLLVDRSGNIFGTTFEGGDGFVGTVFEVTP